MTAENLRRLYLLTHDGSEVTRRVVGDLEAYELRRWPVSRSPF